MNFREFNLTSDPVRIGQESFGVLPDRDSSEHPVLKIGTWLAAFMFISAIGYLTVRLFNFSGSFESTKNLVFETLQSRIFWSAVAVGVLAQTIDGALGMAYGITSNTFLIASGISPAVATASVHIAEVFTTGISGISHVRLKNVNAKLFLRLLVPGLIGALAGAALVSSIDGKVLKPYISVYLFVMGLYLISKIFRKYKTVQHEPKHVAKLALFGGFVDSVGGGGWGPVVTTTLIGSGHDPRTTIGSVNFAEFFLAFGSAIAFSVLVDDGPWPIVAGLVLGGIFTAPLAALLTRKLQAKALLILVGVLISLVSAVNLYKAFCV